MSIPPNLMNGAMQVMKPIAKKCAKGAIAAAGALVLYVGHKIDKNIAKRKAYNKGYSEGYQSGSDEADKRYKEKKKKFDEFLDKFSSV